MGALPHGYVGKHCQDRSLARRARLALAVVVVLAAGACGDGGGSLPETPATTAVAVTELAPVETVEAFYASWAGDNIPQAMTTASPDFESSVGDGDATSEFMSFTLALGRVLTTSDCTSTRNGASDIVSCTIHVEDPTVAALELRPPRAKHTLTDGVLVKVDFNDLYLAADEALASYAHSSDADGFAAACASGTAASGSSNLDPVYTGTCGEFLSNYSIDTATHLIVLAETEIVDIIDPAAVVRGFYDAWGSGDVEAAVAFLSPDVTSPAGPNPGQGLQRLRNYMEYITAIQQTVTISECSTLGSTLVTCHVEYRDQLIDTLGIAGSNALHEVSDGLLTFVTISTQYAKADSVLAQYLADVGGQSFGTACALPDDGSVWGEFGIAYNAPCGSFALEFVADVVAGP